MKIKYLVRKCPVSPILQSPNHTPTAKVVKTVTNLVHLLKLYNYIISNFNCKL